MICRNIDPSIKRSRRERKDSHRLDAPKTNKCTRVRLRDKMHREKR